MSDNHDDEAREWFLGTGNPVEVRMLGTFPLKGIITSWNMIGIVVVNTEMTFVPWMRVERIVIPEPATDQEIGART